MSALQYCYDLAAPVGSALYYSLRFSPKEQSEQAVVIFALYKSLQNNLYNISEPEIAENKMQWWRVEIDNAFQGKATHPITQSLEGILEKQPLPPKLFHALWTTTRQQFSPAHNVSLDDFRHYCHETAGIRNMMLAALAGELDPTLTDFCQSYGVFLETIRVLESVRRDIKHDRILLPLELLAKHEVSLSSLYQYQPTGHFQACLQELATFANDQRTHALSQLTDHHKQALQVLLRYGELQKKVLSSMQKKHFPVLVRVQNGLPPIQLCWHAWRMKL